MNIPEPNYALIPEPSIGAFRHIMQYLHKHDHTGGAGGSMAQYIPKSILAEQGDIIYASAAATPAALTHANAGDLLQSGGHGVNPSWIARASIDHGDWGGLTDGDDHTQYFLSAGREGGQTGCGGTDASESLTLKSTNHEIAGVLKLNPVGSVDVIAIENQIAPIFTGIATSGIYNDAAPGNNFHLSSYVKSSGTRNTVAIFGGGRTEGNGSNVWGGNFVGYVNSVNSTAIGCEVNFGKLIDSGYAHGLVLAAAGNYAATNYIQIQSNTEAARPVNGIYFNSGGGIQPVTGALIKCDAISVPNGLNLSEGSFSVAAIQIPNNCYITARTSAGDIAGLLKVDSSDNYLIGYTSYYNNIIFYPGAAERMRLTASGNLCLGGITDSFQTTAGRRYLTIAGDTDIGVLELVTKAADGDGVTLGLVQFVDKNSVATNKIGMSIRAILEGATPKNRGCYLVIHTKPDGSNVVERMRIDSAGNVRIGSTDAPLETKLFVAADDIPLFRMSVAGVTYGPNFSQRRARGTHASLSIVQDGDLLGGFICQGYDGAAYRNAGRIVFYCDGIPGSANMPGRIEFRTTPSGSATEQIRMVIKNDGNVGIRNTAPTAYLQLAAGAAAASSAPLKFTSGTNLTTPETGAMEFNGTNLYFTPAAARKTFAFMDSLSGTAPITYDSGTGAMSLANQAANTVLAGPATGEAAAPTFRALGATDIPQLAYSSLSGLPALGGAAALDVGTTAGTVAAGDHIHAAEAATEDVPTLAPDSVTIRTLHFENGQYIGHTDS